MAHIKKTINWNLFLDVIFLSGALMNFLPLFLGYTLKSSSPDGEYPEYLNKLQDFPFKSSLVAGVASCVPFLIDLVLDRFSNILLEQKYVPRKAIISALMIPDLLYLCYILPHAEYNLIPGLGGMRDTLFHYVILSHLNLLQPDMFSRFPTILVASLVMIINIILSFSLVLSDESKQFNLFVIAEFIFGIMSAMVIYLCCNWGFKLYQQRHEQTSLKDQTSSIYIISYTAFFFIDYCFGFYPNLACDPLWSVAGANFSTLSNYAIATTITIISVITTRLTRIESEENKSKIRQTFVSYFCHEMNTPLNSAVMGIDILKHSFSDKGLENSLCFHDVIADIEQSCNTLVGILKDLVIYERVESNELNQKFPGIFLFPVILEQLNYYQELALNRNISLVIHDNCTHDNYSQCMVYADKGFIQQITRTILSNSLESANSGGNVDVTLSLRSNSFQQHRFPFCGKNSLNVESYELYIEVRDDGPRLSDTAIENLFQGVEIEFTAGVIEMGRLSGFGILVSRKLLQLLGGSIDYSPLQFGQSDRAGTDTGPGIGLGPQRTSTLEEIIYEPSHRQTFGNLISVRIPVIVSGSNEIVANHSIANDLPSGDLLGNTNFHNVGHRNHSDFNHHLTGVTGQGGGPLLRHQSHRQEGGRTNQQLSHSNYEPVDELGAMRVKPSPLKPITRRTAASLFKGHVSAVVARDECSSDKSKDGSEKLQIIDALAPSPTLPIKKGEALKALVVDDSVITRKMLVRVIETVCETVETAGDGQEAVEIFQRALEDGNPFDIVLMDYQMPRMDGPSAAKIMREMGYKGPIIGVTGNILPAHTKTFLVNGANVVLLKPVKSEDLLRTIWG